MTITETIWASVYAAEMQRLLSDFAVAQRRPLDETNSPAEAAQLAAFASQAALQADNAVRAIPEATQATLAARILALKP